MIINDLKTPFFVVNQTAIMSVVDQKQQDLQVARQVLDLGCVPPSTRSPSGGRSKAEKTAIITQYRISTAQFGKVLDCLLQVSNSLDALANHLTKTKDGRIPFPMFGSDGKPLMEGNEPLFYVFTKRHLTTARQKYHKAFKQLKIYHQYANKRVREIKPENFRGVYAPVFLEPRLLEFLTTADFGSIDPANDIQQPLTAGFRAIPQGFAQKTTITTLFYIHVNARVTNAQVPGKGNLIVPRGQFLDIFGNRPSAYILVNRPDADVPTVNKCGQIKHHYPREHAPNNQRSSFTVLEEAYPPRQEQELKRPDENGICHGKVDEVTKQPIMKTVGFNRNMLATYYFQSIASLNYTGFKEASNQGRQDLMIALDSYANNKPIPPNVQALRQDMLADAALVGRAKDHYGLVIGKQREEGKKAKKAAA